MTFPRAPWWMYVVAASFLGLFCFVIYADIVQPGPFGIALTPAGDGAIDFTQGNLHLQKLVMGEGHPLERAGVRDGDRILAIDGDPIRSEEDWERHRALARAGQPMDLEIDRDGKRFHTTLVLQRGTWLFDTPLQVKINYFGWRGLMFWYVLLSFFVFLRPRDLSARLVSLAWAAFGAGVASPMHPGYGWAGTWRTLPWPLALFLTIPLLSVALFPVLVFSFCAVFPRDYFPSLRQLLLWCAPGLLLAPLMFLNIWPMYGPIPKDSLLTMFGAETVLYGGAGFVVMAVNYRRLQDQNERRRVRFFIPALAIFSTIAVHDILTRNWTDWFGTPAPTFFSPTSHIVNGLLFQLVPLLLAYAILKHRVFEFGLVIRRGIQYALARGVVVWAMPAAVALFFLDVAVHSGDIGVAAVGNFFAHSSRGWVYGVIGALALVAQRKRQEWISTIDRRFFRERYNAQQLLRQTAEELRASRSLEDAAPRIVTRIEAALHPEFCALMVREPNQPAYICQASAPAGIALLGLAADSKLMAVFRVFGKPLQISLSESGWLKERLPHADTDFLRQARIELLVPVSLSATGREALLALGQKKSEEPYGREDEELLLAIANSLALLLERPAIAAVSSGLEECPRCGRCYDSGAGKCIQDASQLTSSSLSRLLAGRYRLDRRLGRGGMGTVYSALDTSLDRQVAVKLIREDLVSSAEAAERFRREAKAAAAITHPNLVTLHDFAVDADHRAYLVMELLSGVTLRQRLQKQGRLPAERVLEILRGVCSGMAVAHQRGLVHRDLKPENIFLAENAGRDVPKILDFGLAKFVASGDAATQVTVDTGTGVLVGTPLYASPDQLRGEPVAASWDLWALAVLTYEMVSGAYPFGNPNSLAALHNAILSSQFRSIDKHLPQAPVEWQEFFTRSLSVDASRRPGSAVEFLAECERVFAKPSPQSAN